MKIGIFTDSYKPYTSGVVTSISTFKEELEKLGHKIYIFAPSYPGDEVEEEGVYRYYSMQSPTNHDFALAIPVLPGMNMLLKRLDLDIIHVHSPFTMGRVGMHFANRHNIPLLFTYHTLYDQYAHYVPLAQDLVRDIALKLSNNFCNQCDHIVVPSTDVEELLRSYNIHTDISVIPTGVPLHKFQGKKINWLRNNYDLPRENKILLFVGRLTREKNLEFLIEAFTRIQAQMGAVTLVLTAGGPLEEELRELAESLNLTMGKDIVFTGPQPFDTLVDIYYSSDLFVFSSLTETQGLVLIEAMAAGLPVVAVSACGVQDMVDSGVNGILTAANTNEFAAAVLKILEDDKMYHYYQKNALQKAESLSSRNMALKLERVYQELDFLSPPRRTKMQELIARMAPDR